MVFTRIYLYDMVLKYKQNKNKNQKTLATILLYTFLWNYYWGDLSFFLNKIFIVIIGFRMKNASKRVHKNFHVSGSWNATLNSEKRCQTTNILHLRTSYSNPIGIFQQRVQHSQTARFAFFPAHSNNPTLRDNLTGHIVRSWSLAYLICKWLSPWQRFLWYTVWRLLTWLKWMHLGTNI